MNRKNTLIVLMILFLWSPLTSAARLTPLRDDWGTTLDVLFGGAGGLEPLPTDLLTQLERTLTVSRTWSNPYRLRGDSTGMNWDGSTVDTRLVWPLLTGGQPVVVGFSVREAGEHAAAWGTSSRLSLDDDLATTGLTLAHHWLQGGIRWGLALNWRHIGAADIPEPVLDIAWGETSGYGFRFSAWRRVQQVPLNWTLHDSTAAGLFSARLDGAAASIVVGDAREARVIAGAVEERHHPASIGVADRRLSPEAELRNWSLRVEHRTGSATWDVGGLHIEYSGTLDLLEGEGAASGAADLRMSYGRWGTGITRWRTGNAAIDARVDWVYLNSNGTGRLSTAALPTPFTEIVGADRLFSGEGRLRGVKAVARASRTFTFAGVRLEAGCLNLTDRGDLRDRNTQGGNRERFTRIPVKALALAWGTASVRLNHAALSVEISGSQAVVLSLKLRADAQLQPAAVRGGWFLTTKLGVRF